MSALEAKRRSPTSWARTSASCPPSTTPSPSGCRTLPTVLHGSVAATARQAPWRNTTWREGHPVLGRVLAQDGTCINLQAPNADMADSLEVCGLQNCTAVGATGTHTPPNKEEGATHPDSGCRAASSVFSRNAGSGGRHSKSSRLDAQPHIWLDRVDRVRLR